KGIKDAHRFERSNLLESIQDVSSELVEGFELEGEQLYRSMHAASYSSLGQRGDAGARPLQRARLHKERTGRILGLL
ncbi:MAG: hypothetical protein GY925_03320, partial [Actinomycetia bacterium]|nr:hypothetical protein [Actinomycetes bacterium]